MENCSTCPSSELVSTGNHPKTFAGNSLWLISLPTISTVPLRCRLSRGQLRIFEINRHDVAVVNAIEKIPGFARARHFSAYAVSGLSPLAADLYDGRLCSAFRRRNCVLA